MITDFHADTVSLLGSLLRVSDSNLHLLSEKEHRLGIKIPASVREWYSFEGGVEILRQHSNDDHPVPLTELGEVVEKWYGKGPRNFVAEGLLWIMMENQGVCNWAVRLDGTNVDPPVEIAFDSAPNDEWLRLTRTFSEFVYCQVWDYQSCTTSCGAQELDLAGSDLEYLRTELKSEPTTAAWPGNMNYRFGSSNGRITIWHSENHGADWHLRSNSTEGMRELIETVWRCGDLAHSLYANDEVGERILKSLR